MKKFTVSFLVLVLLLGLTLTGLAGDLEKKVVGVELFNEIGSYGGEYTLSLNTAPQTFNYYGAIDGAANNIMSNILDSLLEANPVTQEIEPGLAKSWKISEDGKTVTFNLRRGVKWSDGEPFTAADVIFTMKELMLNPNAEANEVNRFRINGKMVKFEKIDDYTVIAHLPAPYGPFLKILTHGPILPEHKLIKYVSKDNPGAINEGWSTGEPIENIVGTGPFKLAKYVVDQKVVLEKNPYSWKYDLKGNQLPYIDRLVYLIIKNKEVGLAKFQAGEIDRLTILGTDYTPLKKAEMNGASFKVLTGSPVHPTPSPTHLAFNFDVKDKGLKEAFRNVRFREAMAYLIDRDRIIEEVYNTLAIKSGMPILPSNKAFYNPVIEELRLPYDLDKAREILDELGYKDIDHDGIRELPDGRDFEFNLTASVDKPDHNDIASLLRDNFEAVGLKANLNLIKSSLAFDQALAGEFEVMVLAFGNQPDPQFRKAIWQPGRSLYYWHLSLMNEDRNPIMENMYDWEKVIFEDFEKGQITMEPAQRKTYYDEWQETYARYLPVIFITKGMDLQVVQNDVGNYFINDNNVIVGTNYTVYKK